MSFHFADVVSCSHFSLLVVFTFHILFLLILFKKDRITHSIQITSIKWLPEFRD